MRKTVRTPLTELVREPKIDVNARLTERSRKRMDYIRARMLERMEVRNKFQAKEQERIIKKREHVREFYRKEKDEKEKEKTMSIEELCKKRLNRKRLGKP